MRHPAKLSNILGKLNKNSQRWYMLGRTSSEVFVMLAVALHSLLFLWCCLLFIFTFLDYFSMPPALQIGFSGTGRSPPALSSTLVTFNCLTFSSHFYRERCCFEWAFFTHMCFFFLRSFSTFLPQPAFIKTSLGAGNSSLKFAGLHADPRNTDLAHLFVWFTAIHNLHIQKNPYLNRIKYFHKLLAVKSLVYLLLTRFELFPLVQKHM